MFFIRCRQGLEKSVFQSGFRRTLLGFPRETMGRDSSVGIATRYGLDGPGIESR